MLETGFMLQNTMGNVEGVDGHLIRTASVPIRTVTSMALGKEIRVEWKDYRAYSPEHNSLVIAWGYEVFIEDGIPQAERKMRLCQYIVGKKVSCFIQVPSSCDKVFELHNVTHWMSLPSPPQ